MTLLLHRAERADALAEGLAAVLREPLADPLVEELVIVPTRGVERWLAQTLSQRLGSGVRGGDGVCAGVRFVAPRSLVALLTGRERDDPWDPDRLVWPLLEQIDEQLDQPWCAMLARHLGHGGGTGEHRAGRRYAVARRLAGLYASYAVQRPAVLQDWSRGELTDGAGGALDADLAWQARLWQLLVEHLPDPSPAQRHADTVRLLREGADAGADLPPRVSLFGHTRMPVTQIELLDALARHRDVHLWLPQPSAALWAALDPLPRGPVPRADDTSGELVGHPLLAALGRDARELQRSLPRSSDQQLETPAPAGPGSTLRWLQEDLRRNAAPSADERESRVVDPDDRSVQVHACHGAARQVEVLREVLTGLLQDDPALEPRDILIMCPDVESYAPLVQAAFGLGDGARPADGAHPAQTLRVRLADRAAGSLNPLFEIAAELLEFAAGRLRVSDVRALLGRDVVRRRFGFDEDDLDTMTDWILEAEIRWGMDQDQRDRFGLAGIDQNTWRFGMRRILLAVATDSDGPALGALPVDRVESADVDLAGRLAEFVDRLAAAVDAVRRSRTVAQWMTALREAVLELSEVDGPDAWQEVQFQRDLAELARSGRADTALQVSDVRQLLRDRLRARASRANFRTGTLTVCTMVPMRSVPHRVVCLLGLDDGSFPRSTGFDGDDLLARTPLTGERDPRSEDRQLLLDAVLAATDTLVVTYTGAGEHTGAPRPPAAPLAELLDAARRTARRPDGRDVVVHHPLQPFDRRNLVPGALDTPGPFSFDTVALEAARAAGHRRPQQRQLIAEALPAVPTGDLNLAELVGFFADPAAYFVRERLGVALPYDEDEPADAIPIDPDALQQWQIGDRALRESIRAVSPQEISRRERLRGVVPPGALGEPVLTRAIEGVGALRRPVLELLLRPVDSLDVDIDLGNGRRLTGTIGDLRGDVHLEIGYSRLRAKQRLRSWLTLLALTAGEPGRPWQAVTAGWLLGRKDRAAGYYLSAGLDGQTALARLRELVDVYDRGMREPIPLPLETSFTYAERLRKRSTQVAAAAARKRWEPLGFGARTRPGESGAAARLLLDGGERSFDELVAEPPAQDEAWNAATSRLGQYALRVWQPLLDGQVECDDRD